MEIDGAPHIRIIVVTITIVTITIIVVVVIIIIVIVMLKIVMMMIIRISVYDPCRYWCYLSEEAGKAIKIHA